MAIQDTIVWSALLHNTIVTTEHGNDSKRIVAATEILQQTARQFAKVLNERARLLANSAQFEAALRDAAAIRVLLPGSGVGYLCTGDVYCQQGRYAAAIAIFDQGLEAVPESDPYYHQLQQHRMTAVANNSKRVDFMSQLPLDIIVTNILPRMNLVFSSESPCELLYVSHAWQERVLKQPDLQFNFGQDVDTFNKGHSQLIRFAPHVQKLEGTFKRDAALNDLFSRAHFSHLKQLNVSCNGTTLCDPLVESLKLIGQSLTDLTVLHCPGIRLCDILETCPNLVSLKTSMVDVVMPLSSSSSRYPQLKHLVLDNIRGLARTQANMVDVLSRVPSLLSLEISPMADSNVLPLLHKHCPYLQIIFWDVTRACIDVDTRNLRPGRKGITSAYLGSDGFYFQDDLIELLLHNRNTIQVFEFGAELQEDDAIWDVSSGRLEKSTQQQSPQLVPPPSEILFPRLIQLDFRNLSLQESVPLFKWILLNAPNLQAIQLADIQFMPDIADAITKMKHLSKLQLDLSKSNLFEYVDMKDNYTCIIQFFKYQIAMEDHSTLQNLIIHLDDLYICELEWLSMLSRLRRLKNFELSTSLMMSSDCKQVMAGICQGCPALETLTLDAWDGFADGVLECLYQLSHVRYLTIRGSSLSKVNLLSIAKMPGLERLIFHRCRVPGEVRSLLQQVMPNTKVEYYC